MHPNPASVMFHHFYDETHPKGQGAISADELEALLRYVGAYTRILDAKEWLHKALNGTLTRNEICLTFDDTLRCQYDIAYPVLKSLGLTAFWFVYTSPLEGKVEKLELYRYFRTTAFRDIDDFYYAFSSQLRDSEYGSEASKALEGFVPSAYLREYSEYSDNDRQFRYLRDKVLGPQKYFALMDGMIAESGTQVESILKLLWMDRACLQRLHHENHVIGLHSHTHPTRMADLTPEAQLVEYRTNSDYLNKLLGEQPVAMSHPGDSYSSETLALLRDLGIKIGFRALVHVPQKSSLEYPREDHAYIMLRMREEGVVTS